MQRHSRQGGFCSISTTSIQLAPNDNLRSPRSKGIGRESPTVTLPSIRWNSCAIHIANSVDVGRPGLGEGDAFVRGHPTSGRRINRELTHHAIICIIQ